SPTVPTDRGWLSRSRTALSRPFRIATSSSTIRTLTAGSPDELLAPPLEQRERTVELLARRGESVFRVLAAGNQPRGPLEVQRHRRERRGQVVEELSELRCAHSVGRHRRSGHSLCISQWVWHPWESYDRSSVSGRTVAGTEPGPRRSCAG